MTESTPTAVQTVSTTHIVYSVLRFLRVVRHRRAIVAVTLVIAGLLGAVYYATAERVYAAKARLLVQSQKENTWDESNAPNGDRQGMLPTYELLFSSAAVLNRAIETLVELPRIV